MKKIPQAGFWTPDPRFAGADFGEDWSSRPDPIEEALKAEDAAGTAKISEAHFATLDPLQAVKYAWDQNQPAIQQAQSAVSAAAAFLPPGQAEQLQSMLQSAASAAGQQVLDQASIDKALAFSRAQEQKFLDRRAESERLTEEAKRAVRERDWSSEEAYAARKRKEMEDLERRGREWQAKHVRNGKVMSGLGCVKCYSDLGAALQDQYGPPIPDDYEQMKVRFEAEQAEAEYDRQQQIRKDAEDAEAQYDAQQAAKKKEQASANSSAALWGAAAAIAVIWLFRPKFEKQVTAEAK